MEDEINKSSNCSSYFWRISGLLASSLVFMLVLWLLFPFLLGNFIYTGIYAHVFVHLMYSCKDLFSSLIVDLG